MKTINNTITYKDLVQLFDFFDMTDPSIWANLCSKTTQYIIRGKQQARNDENFVDYYIEDDIEILNEMEIAFSKMFQEDERVVMLKFGKNHINMEPVIQLLNGIGINRMLTCFASMKINIREMLNQKNVDDYKCIAEFIETINMYMEHLEGSHKEFVNSKD